MKEQFKITNTTVKAQRVVNGKDARTAIEKVGHPVMFSDEAGKVVMLQQGQVTVTSFLDSGLLDLRRGGFISIEKVGDFADILKEHAYQAPAGKDKSAQKKGKVVLSGTKGIEDDAVNPDGEPNFIAKAPSSRTPTSGGKRASRSRNNQKSEQG